MSSNLTPTAINANAVVAQLDRAKVYGTLGRGFESCLPRHDNNHKGGHNMKVFTSKIFSVDALFSVRSLAIIRAVIIGGLKTE